MLVIFVASMKCLLYYCTAFFHIAYGIRRFSGWKCDTQQRSTWKRISIPSMKQWPLSAPAVIPSRFVPLLVTTLTSTFAPSATLSTLVSRRSLIPADVLKHSRSALVLSVLSRWATRSNSFPKVLAQLCASARKKRREQCFSPLFLFLKNNVFW